MKKFILNRNLPTWKAGEEFILKEDGNLYGIDGGQEIIAYNYITLEKFDILNNTEWFEEVIEKPKSVWGLESGDYYYRISHGKIFREIWKDGIMFYERTQIPRNLGDVFLTYTEAEKELQKRKAIQKIKKYCWENDINNNYFGLLGYFFKYNQSHKNIEISSSFSKNGNPLGYFSLGNAQKILDNFDEELKIILE